MKRDDDASGKWNHEVVVRTNDKAVEVAPNGKVLEEQTQLKR